MEQLLKLFKHLDTLIQNKNELMRTNPEICNILIKESGIFAQNHIPFEVGELVQLWTNGSKWKVSKNGDTIYIFAIKTPDKYDIKIDAYGWSKKEQKVVIIKGLSFRLMMEQATRVGVKPQPSSADIDTAISDFKTHLGRIKQK